MEDKKPTYQEKLEGQIKQLSEMIPQKQGELNQLIGALKATEGLLKEYLKDAE